MSCGIPLLLVCSESMLTFHAGQDLGHQATGSTSRSRPSAEGKRRSADVGRAPGPTGSLWQPHTGSGPPKDVPPLGGSTWHLAHPPADLAIDQAACVSQLP